MAFVCCILCYMYTSMWPYFTNYDWTAGSLIDTCFIPFWWYFKNLCLVVFFTIFNQSSDFLFRPFFKKTRILNLNLTIMYIISTHPCSFKNNNWRTICQVVHSMVNNKILLCLIKNRIIGTIHSVLFQKQHEINKISNDIFISQVYIYIWLVNNIYLCYLFLSFLSFFPSILSLRC